VDRAITDRPRPVAIAIGSNLGDRRAALQFAIDRLSSLLTGLTASTIIETDPESVDGDVLPDQPVYLNAVVSGSTTLDGRTLLEQLLAIERDYGRERPFPGAPRTLDLDLILLGDDIIDEPGLHVPHPRFRDRFFVLGPLAEIAPALVDPVTGLRVGELLVRLLRDERR
jgi:2-amino-4-hydroxy-6-hydroxymethyldihydropteridine diphosphokinase